MPSLDVGKFITTNSIRNVSYRMPVLSPRHSSSLSGSYRSTYSTSLSRPYYGSSSYSSPRISTSSYSERYSSKSYSSDDGKKLYSRHSSITEDGITTRYREREEIREKSLRRDSLSRDSGFRDSSTRSNSLRDSSIGHERELSLTRSETSGRDRNNYSSTLSMLDSVADLRNKYSPSNYVPAVLRKQDISRSKSINDIGRPPITETKTTLKTTGKKVNKINNENGVLTINSMISTNNTNDKEKLDNNAVQISDDNNGNRSSVAEIRKKFDPNPSYGTRKPSNWLVTEGNNLSKTIETKNKTSDTQKTNKIENENNKDCLKTNSTTQKTKLDITTSTTTSTTIITSSTIHQKSELLGGSNKFFNRPAKYFKINLEIQENENKQHDSTTASDFSDKETSENDSAMELTADLTRPHNHTTNFASYIPTNYAGEIPKENSMQSDEGMDNSDNATTACVQNRIVSGNNDITTSPRLPRSSISSSSSITNNTLNSNASGNRTSPTNNRTSPINNRSPTPASALDGIRARSLVASDEERSAGNHYERSGTSNARSHGLNGLKNIGNTCFMNSVIQCLSNTKYLLEYVKEDSYIGDINTSISSMKGALIKAFSQVIQELWSPDSSDKVVNTVALKSQIQRFAPRFMGYAQQDAQEFLRYLLEGLHEDVNRVTSKPKPILTEIEETLSDAQKAAESWSRYLRMDNSRVVDIFVGQLKSTLRCTHCGHCSVTFDPFWDLSLPIPQRQGPLRLGQCLEHFTREETLDGDEKPTCSKCKERRKCTKSFSIQKFPKILVIHLKRFSPTERFRGKLNLVIDFPLQGLDLSPYAANKNQAESIYNLYAISNHSGTTYSGHYTAYCKHPYSGQWHEYNDSRVTTISAKNVVSSEAYVLFYELVGQNSHL